MKKVMLFLVVLGLVVGLAQAQTPQVRLVWEKNYRGEVGHFALDVVNNRPVAVIGYAGSARMIDEAGREITLPNMQGFAQVHLSPKGRYAIGRKREPGKSGIRALGRNGWVGSFHQDDDPYLNPASFLITEDGERMAAVKGGRQGSGDNIWSAPDDTVFLFNRSGSIVASIAAPYLRSMVFSEKDHRLYLVQQPFVVQGKDRGRAAAYQESVLKCYDQNGRLLWREGSPVRPWESSHTGYLAVDSLGRLCHVVWSDHQAGYAVAFYDLIGRREAEVRLPSPSDSSLSDYDYRSRGNMLHVSLDGKRAVFSANASIYMTGRDSAKVLWEYHESGGIGAPVLFEDGMSVVEVAEGGPYRRGKSHICLLDTTGRKVWLSKEGFTSTDLKSCGKWFLTRLDSSTFRLFEISK